MLTILETDDLKTVRELERLRIEATRRNDPDVLAPLSMSSSSTSTAPGRSSTRSIISIGNRTSDFACDVEVTFR